MSSWSASRSTFPCLRCSTIACEQLTAELLGARVLVPFGRGQRAGVILEVGGEPQVAPERIKPVAHVFGASPAGAATCCS